MRKFYIEKGVLKPDQPSSWVSSKPTLKMDAAGHEVAQQHIYEYEYNKFMGLETEFPLDQLPECVREYWEENGRV